MANFKKANGTWKFRFSYYTPDGNRHYMNRQGFKTKREAEITARNLEVSKSKGFTPLPSKKSLRQYFTDWYNLYVEPTARFNTKHHYTVTINILKKYSIGNYTISEITPDMYQDFINEYGKTRAKWTVKKLNSQIRTAVKRAIFDGILYRDFTQHVTLVFDASRSRDAVWLNAKQTETVILDLNATIPKSRRPISRYMVFTDLLTGLRLGELMALTWKDLNLNTGELTVNKSWDYINDCFKDTKTASSVRTIVINQRLIDCLYQLHDFQLIHNNVRPDTKIFLNNSHQISSVAALNKQVRAILDECNIDIPDFHFHSLRHSHASYLLYKEVSIFSISQRLGHSNTQITMNVYSHVIDEMHKSERAKTIAALDDLN